MYLPEVNALLAGDSLMTYDPMLGRAGPLVFAEHPKANREAFESLAFLRPYADASLLPAHGQPWLEP